MTAIDRGSLGRLAIQLCLKYKAGNRAVDAPASIDCSIYEFDRLNGDQFRHLPELVRELGGDPRQILLAAGIDPDAFDWDHARFGYLSWSKVVESAASTLNCPDFGLRLALRQGGSSVFGPIGTVMKNAATFGDGLRYFADHTYAHSPAARVRMEWDAVERSLFVSHQILVGDMATKCQMIEQFMLLGHLNAVDITGGHSRAREIRFRHQPLSSPSIYHDYFGCRVSFDQQEDGVVYYERDLVNPILDADVQVYCAEIERIEAMLLTAAKPPMHALVRSAILPLLGVEDCSIDSIATYLNIHPRTLHRRLSIEGTCFQDIKNDIRKDVALYYLEHTDLDFGEIAQRLGFAEHSVLTRKCIRWFRIPPSEVRRRKRVHMRFEARNAGLDFAGGMSRREQAVANIEQEI